MRTRTIIGLAVAGGAAAVAVGVGGTALAAGPERAEPAVQVTVDNGQTTTPGGGTDSGTGSATQWDCPEKDGAGPGASPGSEAPGSDAPAATTL
ncbi:hypothetical protein [Paractinoplanes maris]|uniref:hypothetical protein n=1 Tax=Paractinoplanes maris TaxID=1734446 RepID=UPI00201FC14B|nr:hypothetical protein [Actinoplanes maris]